MQLMLPLATRRATIHLAQALAGHCTAGDLVVLSGALGAGKTFWTRALCRSLGLSAREPVTSPTFALVRELATQPKLAHADLYRLRDPREVESLGLREYRDEGWLVVVEWGEPYQELLGGGALLLGLSLDPREATLSAHAARWQPVLQSLAARFNAATGSLCG